MKKLTKKAGILAAMLMMFGTVTFAQERENVGNTEIEEFNEYDVNTDRQWDRDEFNTRMDERRTFDNWDTDRDGTINEDEFNDGTRNWQNQNMGTEENTTGTTGMEGTGTTGTTETTNDVGTFNDWDTNRDGTIDQDEYNEGTFNAWDTDRNGTLSNEEYNRGVGTETDIDTGIDDDGTGDKY